MNYLIKSAAESDLTEREAALLEDGKVYTKKFEDAMEDDFNTADAISAVFELVKFMNTNVSSDNTKPFLESFYGQLKSLCDILGIILEKQEEILDEEIENLIQERQEARKAKNFARADEIRDILQEKGILLKDTREGVQWKRI